MLDPFEEDPKKRIDFLNDINHQLLEKIKKLEEKMVKSEKDHKMEIKVLQEQHKYLEELIDDRFLKLNSLKKKSENYNKHLIETEKKLKDLHFLLDKKEDKISEFNIKINLQKNKYKEEQLLYQNEILNNIHLQTKKIKELSKEIQLKDLKYKEYNRQFQKIKKTHIKTRKSINIICNENFNLQNFQLLKNLPEKKK